MKRLYTDSFGPDHFRRVLGHFPTGVAVVTAMCPDGQPAGMAVGSFTSVSLDPPLVGFLPAKSSTSWPRIAEAGKFCVNILGADQEAVCRTFATKGGDKFAELAWQPTASGAPLLDGVVAWIDCDLENVFEAGDHYIAVGRVRELDVAEPTLPLLFFQGGYGRFNPVSLAAWDAVLREQFRVVDLARREMEQVAADLGLECVASVCAGEELVLVASAGRPRTAALPTRVGQRLPFAPPLGGLFVAWAPQAEQRAWLDRGIPSEAAREALALLRFRGYSVGLGHAPHDELEALLAGTLAAHPSFSETALRRLASRLPLDQVGAGEKDVRSVAVPVFDAESAVVLVLSVYGLPDGCDARQAEAYASRLRKAADAVTSAIGGRRPF